MNASSDPPAVSLIIPILNQEPRLEDVVRQIGLVLGDRPEIILVYDVTRQDIFDAVTAEQEDLQTRYGVRCLTRTDRRGFGSAIRAGFAASRGDVIIPIMGDCSDDIPAIPLMLERIQAGADIVAGARYIPGGAIVGDSPKQQVSRAYSKITRIVSAVACDDVSNSFRAYRRSVWENIENEANSFDVSVEMTVKAAARGFRLDQVPAVWTNRAAGKSQFSMRRELPNYGRWLVYAARHKPSRSLIMAITMAVLGTVVLALSYSRRPSR